MKPTNIIIHHSATKDGKTLSWQAIRKYHKSLGWTDIGYHFGIENVNGEIEILMGRMIDKNGAHCRQEGMNGKSIGICLVGNFDIKEVPKNQWNVAINLVASLCVTLKISIGNIHPHHKFANKTCPGTTFDMVKFKKDVRRRMNSGLYSK